MSSRCARDAAQERYAGLREVVDGAAEMVGRERAAGAALRFVGAEHEVVDDELRPAVEEVGKRLPPVLGVEAVALLHRHPWQFPAAACELVAARPWRGLPPRRRRPPVVRERDCGWLRRHDASLGRLVISRPETALAIHAHRERARSGADRLDDHRHRVGPRGRVTELPRPDASRHPARAALTLSADAFQST
jgi:hypothetical protein